MAQQETYGNWLGPGRLQRQPGIYSPAGTLPPLGHFRPASPESFEDDYDDVSMAGSERGPPAKGVYLLAGAPGSSPAPPPSERGSPGAEPGTENSRLEFRNSRQEFGNSRQEFGNSRQEFGSSRQEFGDSRQEFGSSRQEFGDSRQEFGSSRQEFGSSRQESGGSQPGVGNSAPGVGNSAPRSRHSGPKRGRGLRAAALALLGLGWAALLALGIGKHQELRAELELLKENFSGIWDSVLQDQTQLRFGMRHQQLEQQELAELLCRALGSSRRCGPGWQQHGSSCYSFSRDALSWGRARNACAELGAQLAVVNDEEEQVFLLENSNRSSCYWLGLTDQEQEGKWRWLSGQEPQYIFWDVWLKEEQQELKDCGALGPKGRWVSALCSQPLRWICERPNSC